MLRLFLTLGLTAALVSPSLAARPTWEEDLGQVDYLVGQLSLINLINGLHLTAEQATRLRDLAKWIEAVAGSTPSPQAKVSPEIEQVRKTYFELADVLMRGDSVPPDLERRVIEARAIQAKVVRSTLRPQPQGRGVHCSNCHTEPPAVAAATAAPMTMTETVRRDTDMGHYVGDYGWAGLILLVRLSPKVEATLTDAQKSVFGNFACCLMPPQDMGDPVRAGQADFPGKELELLRKVRDIPAAEWPDSRAGILRGVDAVAEMVSPGVTADKKADIRRTVGEAMDRARKLDDTSFELEKDTLARTVKDTVQPPQPDSPNRAAYFLLFPGASKIYTQYLERLSKTEPAKPAGP